MYLKQVMWASIPSIWRKVIALEAGKGVSSWQIITWVSITLGIEVDNLCVSISCTNGDNYMDVNTLVFW